MISYDSEGIAMPKIKKRETTAWIKAVVASYKRRLGDIGYMFVDDEKILEVNREYLGHDYYTDVITFDYDEDDVVSGDIVISLDTVRSSYHVGMVGKYNLEHLLRRNVEVALASEFRYSDPIVDDKTLVIIISQSGETLDTMAALREAKKRGAYILSIVNVVGSSIARETDTGTYIHVGPEIGVASTKAFTGQVTVLTLLALAIGNEKGTISADEYQNITEQLWNIPEKMKEVLKLNNKIADLSRTFTYARNFIYLGRGFQYPVALEGALKLKEISYIHAEGYPAAEMKHGPIALIDSDMPVVVIATHNFMYEKVLSNIQEVKARNGRVIAIVSKGDETISKIADEVIELPETLECLEPLLATIPLQLLAYHVAVCKGKDVDQPRNLAKSVTVE